MLAISSHAGASHITSDICLQHRTYAVGNILYDLDCQGYANLWAVCLQSPVAMLGCSHQHISSYNPSSTFNGHIQVLSWLTQDSGKGALHALQAALQPHTQRPSCHPLPQQAAARAVGAHLVPARLGLCAAAGPSAALQRLGSSAQPAAAV